MNNLSLTQLRAWLSTGLWGLVAVGFAAAFFTGGGSADFHVDRSRQFASVVALMLGYAGHFGIVTVTGKRAGAGRAIDERDLQVLARAGQTTLTVYLLAQYLVAYGLWTVFEPTGSVPVGWLYLLAGSAPILGSLAYAVATIVLDRWSRATS